MSGAPSRFLDDPEWGEAFEAFAEEAGQVEGLPDDVRAEVATMVAASLAGAVGVAAAGAASSTAVSGASVSGASTAVASGASAGVAASSGTAVASGTAAASGAALSSGVGAAAATSAVATGAAAATTTGVLGAASASFAALGLVPKIVAVVSVVGAVTAGGVAAGGGVDAVKRSLPLSAEVLGERGSSSVEESGGQDRRGVSVAGSEALVAAAEKESDFGEGEPVRDGAQQDSEEELAALAPENPTPLQEPREPMPRAKIQRKKSEIPGGLAGEVALLKRVRSLLSKNPEAAWAALNEYNRRYPEGALRSEYEALVARAQTAMPPGGE